MGRSQLETVCALQPAARSGRCPVPSPALLARLAPLTPVPGRLDLVAHHAPDVMALWQAWEEECGAPQAVPSWATVWPAVSCWPASCRLSPPGSAGRRCWTWAVGAGVAGIAALYAGADPGRGRRHRPGGPRHRRAECHGQCGRAAPAGHPAAHAPAPRVSPVFSSRTSSMGAPRRRSCGPGCARPTGEECGSSLRTRPGRLPPRPGAVPVGGTPGHRLGLGRGTHAGGAPPLSGVCPPQQRPPPPPSSPPWTRSITRAVPIGCPLPDPPPPLALSHNAPFYFS